jgi:hypothetical protein
MGVLMYGSPGVEFTFDDRTLTHLLIVITTKLRRHESFVFSWSDPPEAGSGRSTIWLDSSSTLFYRFSGGRIPLINTAWIDVLSRSASSGTGLTLTAEPVPTPGPPLIRKLDSRQPVRAEVA